ncbi:heavy-metal-associated domain-containing protein [Corynebacterium poyangense]|nr:heavy-metal-associated domain-containing protein [Corynebacterium poyangense]
MIKNYSIKGMTCEHCSHAVAEEINDIPGVQGVTVDLADGVATVTGEGFSDQQIEEAVVEAGYTLL